MACKFPLFLGFPASFRTSPALFARQLSPPPDPFDVFANELFAVPPQNPHEDVAGPVNRGLNKELDH